MMDARNHLTTRHSLRSPRFCVSARALLNPPLKPAHDKGQCQRDRHQKRLGHLVLLVKCRQELYHDGDESRKEDVSPEELQNSTADAAPFFIGGEGENEPQRNYRKEEGVNEKDVDIVVGIVVVGKKSHEKERAASNTEKETQKTLDYPYGYFKHPAFPA